MTRDPEVTGTGRVSVFITNLRFYRFIRNVGKFIFAEDNLTKTQGFYHFEELEITIETPQQNRQSLSNYVCDFSFLEMTTLRNMS